LFIEELQQSILFIDISLTSTAIFLILSVVFFTEFGRPRAYGVIFKDSFGGLHRAFLRPGLKNEVILSAGALGSPQLLMLSGIGPAPDLRLHGIEVVVNNPLVGQGMADNPMNAIFIPSPSDVETSLIQAVGITEFESFIEAASGSSSTGAFMQNLLEAAHMLASQV